MCFHHRTPEFDLSTPTLRLFVNITLPDNRLFYAEVNKCYGSSWNLNNRLSSVVIAARLFMDPLIIIHIKSGSMIPGCLLARRGNFAGLIITLWQPAPAACFYPGRKQHCTRIYIHMISKRSVWGPGTCAAALYCLRSSSDCPVSLIFFTDYMSFLTGDFSHGTINAGCEERDSKNSPRWKRILLSTGLTGGLGSYSNRLSTFN